MTIKHLFPLMMFFSSPQVIADQSDLNNFNDKEKSLKVIINEFTNTTNEEFNAFLQEKRNEMLSSVEQRFLNCDKDNDDTLDVFETTLCLPQVARQFRQVDSNKDNLISLDELSILAKEYYKDINKEAFKKAKPNPEKFAKEN
ncbi:hypothetical protein OAO78_03910 [Methylophilaceae bacterium]|nr:hypothetical protein [Methylophilaceae bacterium]